MSAKIPQRIVAEVSVSYCDGRRTNGSSELISQVFERVIRVNAERGYTLESWKFQQSALGFVHGDSRGSSSNETIIAVFVKVDT